MDRPHYSTEHYRRQRRSKEQPRERARPRVSASFTFVGDVLG
jgi:hypothetical protein